MSPTGNTVYEWLSEKSITSTMPPLERKITLPLPPKLSNPSSHASLPLVLAQQKSSRSSRLLIVSIILLSLVIGGTVIVLSSVTVYLAIPRGAFLSELEIPWMGDEGVKAGEWIDVPIQESAAVKNRWTSGSQDEGTEIEVELSNDVDDGNSWDGIVEGTDSWERLYNVTTRPGETIPRIIHQTWKDNTLPVKWRNIWQECRSLMPDYEYFLWTDSLSRQFIATHYPAYLVMYDSYPYQIQRADAIRYFVLEHFGGVYMDLDIGCQRRIDPLLQGDWEVVLPITKPVGVSNDIMLSSKGSDFMRKVIRNLPTFNRDWWTNYPTVMFSTGPMFLSILYSQYISSYPSTTSIRILPTSLYGKNADPIDVPHSFFSHYYGSSWHGDDADFIGFLGSWGKVVLVFGMGVLGYTVLKVVWGRYIGSFSGFVDRGRCVEGDSETQETEYWYLPVLSPVDIDEDEEKGRSGYF